MKNKLILLVVIGAVLCGLIVGCSDDATHNTNGTLQSMEPTDVSTSTQTEPAKTIPDINTITYLQFEGMSIDEQQAVIDSFATNDEFLAWYLDIKQTHEAFQNKLKPQPTTGDGNDPENTEEPTVSDPAGTEEPAANNPQAEEMTFLKYHNLSAAEQKAFINTFSSIDEFVEWHSNAKQKYMDSMIEIDGTTPIDLDDVSGGD